jgi:hypothetical protein
MHRMRASLASPLIMTIALWGVVRAQNPTWSIPERGAVEYERRTVQWSVSPPAADERSGRRVLLAAGADGGPEWRYRQVNQKSADGFERADFDDGSWSRGFTPIASQGERTTWPANVPFLEARASFSLSRRLPKSLVLRIDHDDVAEVWINSEFAYRGDKYLRGVYSQVPESVIDTMRTGENIVAVRIHNTGGASWFDLSLTGFERSMRKAEQATNLAKALDDAAIRVRNGLLPGFRAGPFLCAGQLDASGVRPATPGIDLRDLPAFIGFDLERVDSAGTFSGEAPRCYRFGDIAWKGRANPPDATGKQTLEARFVAGIPAMRGDDKRFVERHVITNNVVSHELVGTLRIDRRFDAATRTIQWMRTRIEADVKPRFGDDASRTSQLVLEEEWTRKAVRENRDGRFHDDVVAAIAKGAQKLRAEIGNLGVNHLRNEPNGNRSYNSGRLALALLAMIHAELPKDDPVLVAGLNELRKRRFVDCYSTAHAIMALEAYHAPRGEREELRSGSIDRPRQRMVPDEDKKLIAEWVAILLSDIDTRTDTGYLLRFNYVAEGRYDHSVNQYGLLGLYSAMLCGVEVPKWVWTSAANHLIADQERPTKEIKLELLTYQQLERMKSGGTTSGARGVGVAGWGYHGPKSQGVAEPIYGSMTCAGIAGLTICLAGMRDVGLARGETATAAERAIQRGFAWIAENYTLHYNARRYHQPYYWVYYYLYGLERACELSGIALINGRDWYYEGALTLLALQQGDGGWPDDHHPDEVMERTAMAVLFLKKSSAPVYTQK